MIKFRARYNLETDDYELFVLSKVDGKNYSAEPIILKERKEGLRAEPAAVIDSECYKSAFQDLLDDLWGLGIRPSARADEYKAQLDSTRDHLNDMRALVFKGKREDLKLR